MKKKLTTNEQVFKLTVMAVLAALSVVSVIFIHFPIIPAYGFLEYDAADVFILLAGLLFGWAAGAEVLLVASAIQALTVSAGSGWMGFVMHVAATGAMVLISCVLHEKAFGKKMWSVPLCLFFGCIAMTALMVPLNLIITPIFMGAPREAVIEMILPAILPFNAIKSLANSFVAGMLYVILTPILRMTAMGSLLQNSAEQ